MKIDLIRALVDSSSLSSMLEFEMVGNRDCDPTNSCLIWSVETIACKFPVLDIFTVCFNFCLNKFDCLPIFDSFILIKWMIKNTLNVKHVNYYYFLSSFQSEYTFLVGRLCKCYDLVHLFHIFLLLHKQICLQNWHFVEKIPFFRK